MRYPASATSLPDLCRHLQLNYTERYAIENSRPKPHFFAGTQRVTQHVSAFADLWLKVSKAFLGL